MDYVAWSAHPPPGYCILEYLENVDDEYELKRGISRRDGFPDDALFSMKRSSPKAKKLADNVANLDGLAVVSKPLMEFLEAREPPGTEFLRVSILDHKQKVASDEYYIVNPLSVVDCIDRERSDLSWNEIDKELISGCFELVLLDGSLDGAPPIFRPRYMPTVILMARALAEDMEAEGFVGMHFFDLDEFTL